MQTVMSRLILFECRECRVRFPAFHPKFMPPLAAPLQTTRSCSNAVAEWDDQPADAASILAPRHTGLCRSCANDLAAVADDDLLRGVSLFGARNLQDPLAGFPATDVDTLTGLELQVLFRDASILEAMLVALHHMQVSVCMFDGRRDRRSGLTRFRKNIISFPQHVSELQQHLSFVAEVRMNDIVNVLTAARTTEVGLVTSRLRRARVVGARADGFDVLFAHEAYPVFRFACGRPRASLASLASQRLETRADCSPSTSWPAGRIRRGLAGAPQLRRGSAALPRETGPLARAPRRRAHAYVLHGVRLATRVHHRGTASGGRHSCHLAGTRTSMRPPVAMRCRPMAFQQWLWEGRHDCEVALAFLRLFATLPAGSGNASLADFFTQLWEDYAATFDADAPPGLSTPPLLPVSFLARRLIDLHCVPFNVAGTTQDVVLAQLVEQIWEEVHCVEAFVSAWTGSTCVPQPERRLLADCIFEECARVAEPWPTIERDPTEPREEGRFVKAFPLEFPMGVGDLYQARLRDGFSAAAWAQHKFRYRMDALLPPHGGIA